MRPIIFVGSSILEQWSNLSPTILGIPVINKALGGTRTWEIHDIIVKDVLPLNPAMICYYGGSNDINSDESAEAIISRTIATLEEVFAVGSGLSFLYFSIIRAPQKRAKWDIVDEINCTLQRQENRFRRFHFLDVNPVFFDESGNMHHDLFIEDELHLTDRAYELLGTLAYPYVERIVRMT